MTSGSTFRLTFHIFHPTKPASEIVGFFGLATRYSQSVGEPRATKSGKKLKGTYSATNIGFELHREPLSFDLVVIDDFMREKLASFNLEYIKDLTTSGGQCNFLLGVFSSENVMFEVGIETIRRLSTSNTSIKYDFYGGA